MIRSNLFTLLVVGILIVLGWRFSSAKNLEEQATNRPTPTVPEAVTLPPFQSRTEVRSITRFAQLSTVQVDRSAIRVTKYAIQAGDTAWAIAQKFGLKIESILWGNEGMSANAGGLTIGQEINILPVDGVLHTVKEGDTLERVARLHSVQVEDITNFLGNDLPEKPPYTLWTGQKVIVPDGQSPVTWLEPGPVVEPGKGRKSKGFYDGPLVTMGTGTFLWPVYPIVITQPFWSGHPAIDLDTYNRQPVFASDSGTVIFSGWSETGYGNLVIIDHGNGYWTYYAHNEANLVRVGQGVLQGQQIAESGSTGRSTGDHIDFRIRREGSAFLDPAGFLP
jgi:LysM repeat protein